jgi:XTP/dITP diphosphohydrolase
MTRRILLATQNRDKVEEIRQILADGDAAVRGVELVVPPDIGIHESPDETGTTFLANAELKAGYYAARSGLLSVADDSGLSIDAMNGEPGVYSSRFCGENATYPERFAEIWRRLAGVPAAQRTARFTCAIVALAPSARDPAFAVERHLHGLIHHEPRGANGFGYDPIFFYPPLGKTTGQLDPEQKHAISHRGQAFAAFRDWLVRG